jgi:hypothetical protein
VASLLQILPALQVLDCSSYDPYTNSTEVRETLAAKPTKLRSLKIHLPTRLSHSVIKMVLSVLSTLIYLQELHFASHLFNRYREEDFVSRLFDVICSSGTLLSASFASGTWNDRELLTLQSVFARNQQLPQVLVAPRTLEDANAALSLFPTVFQCATQTPRMTAKFLLTGLLTLDYAEHAM